LSLIIIEFNIKMDDVKKIIEEIQKSKIDNKKKEVYYGEKYADFKKLNPVIFEMSCAGKMDMSKFDYMTNLLNQIKKAEITQYDASAEVGQMLFKEFVEPVIPKMNKKP
jgi:hypothetical protein